MGGNGNGMAELTPLDEKLAEVIGLARAAQDTVAQVAKMEDAEKFGSDLDRMRSEAEETERRTTELIETFEGKKTAILEKARETKQEATQMMQTYLGSDADALDGFEFLTMAEAGETGHWQVLGTMNQKAGNPEIQQLVEYVTPIQERHFQQAIEASVLLASEEDPNEPSS